MAFLKFIIKHGESIGDKHARGPHLKRDLRLARQVSLISIMEIYISACNTSCSGKRHGSGKLLHMCTPKADRLLHLSPKMVVL